MNQTTDMKSALVRCEKTHQALKAADLSIAVATKRRDEFSEEYTRARLSLAAIEREEETLKDMRDLRQSIARALEIADQKPRLQAYASTMERLLDNANKGLANDKIDAFEAEFAFDQAQSEYLAAAYAIAVEQFVHDHQNEIAELARLAYVRHPRGVQVIDAPPLTQALRSVAARIGAGHGVSADFNLSLAQKDGGKVGTVPTGRIRIQALNSDRGLVLGWDPNSGLPRFKGPRSELVESLQHAAHTRATLAQERDFDRLPQADEVVS